MGVSIPHGVRLRWGALALAWLAAGGVPAPAGVYVTETSGIRWNDVGGIRWNDVGGIRWNDVGGIRWNDVGGIRWNDVGGVLLTDASGIRWNDVGGIRWNDVGGISFQDALTTGSRSLDLELLNLYSTLPDTSSLNVIVTYRAYPTALDLANLTTLGIPGGTIFRRLPMVVVNASKAQIAAIAALPAVRSVYADRTLSFFDDASGAQIGLADVGADPDLAIPAAGAPTGAGVTIAVLDTGVDGTHPDLPDGTKVVENVRLSGAIGTAPGFVYPQPVAGLTNTDLVLGHGTFVASVAAGSGAASGGVYRGIAPGASVLALAAGDLFILQVLEGFDYILDHAPALGVRVVNCSWGTVGWFDPDDPVNVATRQLYDAGISVVFAAGNHGPSPDTLNPYAVAPWVIGVGSIRKDGRLSSFSSQGVFEELLYHPTLVAPGEGIIGASPIALHAANGGVGVADPGAGVIVPPEHSFFYVASSGTSFAAPHVAGVIALMLEENPALTPTAIKQILQKAATPMLLHDRSQVGAGSLEAWAALTLARYADRPFGTFIPGWLDERPYAILHHPPVEAGGVLPAGGTTDLPIQLGASTFSWRMHLSWGTLPGLNDLDLTVHDGCGAEWARSQSFNGLALFGRTEGANLLAAVPAGLTATISFRAGTGAADQPFGVRQETAAAIITGYTDVAALAPPEQERVAAAVSRHALIGRGSLFEPAASLRRGELARALAFLGGLPQRIPPSPTFADAHEGDSDYPFVETSAGARARKVLIDPQNANSFGTSVPVRRLDFAVSLVRAASLEAEADARAGEVLGLADESEIPAELRGYVAVALERGFIAPLPAPATPSFDPNGSLPRLEAARFLLNLLAATGPPSPAPCFADSDADGTPDAADCSPQNPQLWAVPGECDLLVLSADGETIAWDPPAAPGGGAVTFDLLRSANPADLSVAQCIPASAGGAGTTAGDPSVPDSGELLVYLARAQNGCGYGSVGAASSGVERLVPPCP